MIKKILSRKGESLVEAMAALVVVVLVTAMLPTAVVSAASINNKASKLGTRCDRTQLVDGAAPVATVVSYYDSAPAYDSSSGSYSAAGAAGSAAGITAKGYSDSVNGFYYYTVD